MPNQIEPADRLRLGDFLFISRGLERATDVRVFGACATFHKEPQRFVSFNEDVLRRGD